MRVSYSWVDDGGEEYNIDAEVHPLDRNRITIISIQTGEGVDVDFHEFDDNEQMGIRWEAKRAAQELDDLDSDEEDDEDEDDEDRSDEELDLT